MKWAGLAKLELQLTARLSWAGIRELGKDVFGKKVCDSSCPVMSVYGAVISPFSWAPFLGRERKQLFPEYHSSGWL